MKKIIEFFAAQRVLSNLLAVLVSIAGLYIFVTSPKESLPEIKLGIITVNTIFPGAGPEEVEKLVTDPVEKALAGIKGIKEINSASAESVSAVIISIDQNIKDTATLVNNVKNAVSKIEDLPEDANEPAVTEVTTDEFPVLQIAITGDSDYASIRKAAVLLEERINKIRGVAGLRKTGMKDRVIWVETDSRRSSEYGVTIFSLINAIKNSDFSLPAGSVNISGNEYTARTVSEIKDPDDVKNIVVRSNEAGSAITVAQVADVYEGFEDLDRKVKADGRAAVIFTVLKNRGEDTMRINNEIRRAADEQKTVYPAGVTVKFANDESKFIKDRIDLVNGNGIYGGLLVLLSIIILLRPSLAFLSSLSIPIIFGATIIVMKATGLTFDMLSLFGFVMAIGMLIDNSIVVGENVYRYMEMGKGTKEAVTEGASEVFAPVIGSTLTTIASFLPLVFVGGVLGSFLRPIPVVIILTIVISVVQSYFLMPAQIASFVKPGENRFTLFQKQANEFLMLHYGNMLTAAFKHKAMILAGVLILFIVSFFLGTLKGFSFFTTQVDEAVIKVKFPATYSLAQTEKAMAEAEKKAMQIPGSDLDTVYTYLGFQDSSGGSDETGTNKAQMNVVLKLESQRKQKDINVIIEDLRKGIGLPEGAESVSVSGLRREGGGSRPDIILEVTGSSSERVKEASNEALQIIGSVKGIKEVTTDFEQGKKEIVVKIDGRRAAAAGVNMAQAATVIRAYTAGVDAASVKDKGEDIEIKVREKQRVYKSSPGILDLTVPNMMGRPIALKNIAVIREGIGAKLIKHKDGKNTIIISAAVDRTKTNNAKANEEVLKVLKPLSVKYPDISFTAGGEYREMMKSFTDLGLAFLVAVFLIYIIVATLFNSFTQPLVMMLAIPFGLIGVMLTLFVHGMPLSFAAFMGFVALAGVVTNNSLVLYDFVNRLREEKGDMDSAIITACKIRLRPIILTAVTTIVGLLPLGYGLMGNKDAFLQPVALVFAWGLTISSGITLFVIPILISITSKKK